MAFTATRTSVRYSKDVEVEAVKKLVTTEGNLGWGKGNEDAGHILSELVGVGRFVTTNGGFSAAIEDGSRLLEDSKLLPGFNTDEQRASFVYLVAEMVEKSSELKSFDFSSQLKLVRDILEEKWKGSELSNEATISLAMAAHLVADTKEDMGDWYDREAKYPTADDLLEARGFTPEVMKEIQDYFDPEVGMPAPAKK